MESWIIVLVVLAGAALVLVLVMGWKRQAKLEVVAKRLMTERERQAIRFIEQSFPSARVHAQVAMAALLQTRPGLAKAQRTALRNRFDRKIVDFVVEERATGDVLAIVELDDRTHNDAKDRVRLNQQELRRRGEISQFVDLCGRPGPPTKWGEAGWDGRKSPPR